MFITTVCANKPNLEIAQISISVTELMKCGIYPTSVGYYLATGMKEIQLYHHMV